jgi:hypothetical protein
MQNMKTQYTPEMKLHEARLRWIFSILVAISGGFIGGTIFLLTK